MFGLMSVFTKQFTPVDGGYVYYPSPKGGGRLVTIEEYDDLVANWQRVGGTRGFLTATGLMLIAITAGIFLKISLELPEWTTWILIAALVAALVAWTLPATLAPRRLVKDRPDIAPPRTMAQARRDARAVLSWPFVILFLLGSALIFLQTLISFDETRVSWIWLVVSGLLLAAYSCIAILKLRDRYR